MLTPLDTVNINLDDFNNCDDNVKLLASICAQLIEAVKYTLCKKQ